MLAEIAYRLPGILAAALVLVLFAWRALNRRDDPPPPPPGWPPRI